MGRPVIDLTSRHFGRWTALRLAFTNPKAYWHVECNCGNKAIVRGDVLQRGDSTSCGCLVAEGIVFQTHGEAGGGKKRKRASVEYMTWTAMIQRCENPNATDYEYYGGRGNKVCARWRNSYELFLADMGRRPPLMHSIDRINNDGDYEPDNCRWATKEGQRANRSDSVGFIRAS